MSRKWSIYEQNQLRKWGKSTENLEIYGEMPVEYITGHADFDGHDFLVNSDVLIPRVETVQIVDEIWKLVGDRSEVVFAEIGTGCGAIGLSLAKRLREANKKYKANLVEISEKAVAVAKENKVRLTNDDPDIQIYQSDLMDTIPSGTRFDFIVANLPYIPSSRVSRLPESVVNFEPHIALDGGPEGLSLIKKLLIQAEGRLKPNGFVIQEMDYSHDIPDFVDNPKYQYEIRQDEFGQNRFLLARLKN